MERCDSVVGVVSYSSMMDCMRGNCDFLIHSTVCMWQLLEDLTGMPTLTML